ncbi:MetQ/NlpA family ABC transporter substrate-binding protein [Labilithrix luteola]|uniref:MetQ/NlpA family ABC transporter substrate-binding protein n=1 Tax=Labilithrix luteola TaxID=1391654 RepID=UPI000A70BA57|nr:MetQ/NlpA family ABC transporter substrate-binding protein [Labilithrix luteola]
MSSRSSSLRFVTFVLALALLVVACNRSKGGSQPGTLRVGASAVPHAEILEFAKPLLAKEGVTLQVRTFDDYVQPNLALADGSLDANFFQHTPYLDEFQKSRPLGIVASTKVHIEPMAVYSKRHKAIAEIERGETIAIPNDPSNSGRALKLLEKAGLLKLDPAAGVRATVRDVKDNPKDLRIKELDAAQLPRVLSDVGAAVLNANYALQAGLSAAKDGLAVEDKDGPYANILAVLPAEQNNADYQKLQRVLTSVEVRSFIEKKYGGAVIPAF